MKKWKFLIVFALLFSTEVWAKSWSQIISLSKRDTATSCIKDAEDGYLELKVKRNIDISLPLKELKPFYANDEKWSPQSFLQDNYEVNFPE